jgi:hypothetical protein
MWTSDYEPTPGMPSAALGARVQKREELEASYSRQLFLCNYSPWTATHVAGLSNEKRTPMK